MSGDRDLQIDGLSEFRRVGSGGFADVYEARDEFGRQVAVKVLTAVDDDALRRFDRERAAMGQVAGHPNIVVPFTSGYTRSGSNPFVVMEYVAGGSLQDLLDRVGAVPVADAAALILPIADALAFSHGAGIIHKDIKPGNILLTDSGVPKLADFGIAAIRDATQTSSVAYSLDFTPPETFHAAAGDGGDPRDARSDLYSLAGTLYALVMGRGPFHSDTNATPAGYMARILTGPIPATGDVPFDTFVTRAMAKEPADRFADAQAFRTALAPLAGATTASSGVDTTVVTPPVAQPARPQAVASSEAPSGGSVTIPVDGPGPAPIGSTRSGPPLLAIGAVAAAVAVVAGLLIWRTTTDGEETTAAESASVADDGADAATTGDTDEAEAVSDAGEEEVAPEDAGPEDAGPGEVQPAELFDRAGATSLADLPVPEGERSIEVAILPHPHIDNIASLTESLFTAETGIAVNYAVVDELTLRDAALGQLQNGQQFDVVQVGIFETPQLGVRGLLYDLDGFAAETPAYQPEDLFPSVVKGLSDDGVWYGAPFYAESSFLMYRSDVLAEAGLTMPDNPTWTEVADIARALDTEEMAGICLRGRAGWSDLGASFGTVLNTFGGTWWEANADGSIGEARIDDPAFRGALQFYVDLAAAAGQDDVANASFNECFTLYQNGEVAMWYDTTVAASLLEAAESPVRGLNGYAQAPVEENEASGWLWAWALAILEGSNDPAAAWEYIAWATGPEYLLEDAAGALGGWNQVPPGVRQSLYTESGYTAIAAAYAVPTLEAIQNSPIDAPGLTPRPGTAGVQYVGVFEFQEMATLCTELFSAAIAGSVTVDDALADCQAVAARFSS
ncbi:MAG: extracellular solute-binding protein [Actinomycetota bacterium]